MNKQLIKIGENAIRNIFEEHRDFIEGVQFSEEDYSKMEEQAVEDYKLKIKEIQDVKD